MDTITTTLNQSKDKQYRVACKTCVGKTRHQVLQDVEVKFETAFGEYSSIDKYQIIQCQGCEDVCFRKAHSDSEDFIEDEEGALFHPEREEVYPSRVAGRHELRQVHLLPSKVARIYRETHAALCSNLPILSAVGIRALIETVCKEKDAEGSNLEKKIDNLVTKGVMTQSGAEILHSMRLLGNKAAHEVEPHHEKTLNLAMDIVEHMLNDVYILRASAKALPRRGSD